MRADLSLIASVAIGGALELGCARSNDAEDPLRIGRDASLSDAGLDPSDAAPANDAGVMDQCNPLEQLGCPAPESKCVVEGLTGAECAETSPDDRSLGQGCRGRDCLPRLACARPTETSTQATCVQICDVATGAGCEALVPEHECRIRLDGTNWGACAELPPACDPLTQAPCSPAEACQPFLRRTGAREFRCRRAGTGQERDACDLTTQVVCGRTLACVATLEGEAFCRKICDPDRGNEDCTGAQQCIEEVVEPPFTYCAE